MTAASRGPGWAGESMKEWEGVFWEARIDEMLDCQRNVAGEEACSMALCCLLVGSKHRGWCLVNLFEFNLAGGWARFSFN